MCDRLSRKVSLCSGTERSQPSDVHGRVYRWVVYLRDNACINVRKKWTVRVPTCSVRFKSHMYFSYFGLLHRTDF